MARANFFQAGGSLKKDFPGYVERPADRELKQYLQEGYFCYVLTARQMGKSSLKVRCIQDLQAQGWTCIDIDITSIGSRNSTAEQWYYSILAQVAEELDLEDELDDWWDENTRLTPVARMSTFWNEIALPNTEGNLAIFMDEIDSLLSLDPEEFSTDDFFASIRALYNKQSSNEELRRLHFCILGVATPDDLMVDPSRTPFNIGQAIHLDNLNLYDAAPLLGGLEGFEASPQGILQEVIHWSGGQPYLTQRLCATIAGKEQIQHPRQDVRQIVQELFLEPERVDQDSNLANVNRRFRGMPEHLERMANLYEKILTEGSAPLDLRRPEQIYLKLSGLVKEVKNTLVVNNQIYAHVFNLDWLRKVRGEFKRPFQNELQNWIEGNKNSDFLLRGKALENATVWSYTRDDVSKDEIAFLEASRRFEMDQENKEKERKQLGRQRRILTIGLILAIILLAVAILTSIMAFRQQAIARKTNLVVLTQRDSLSSINEQMSVFQDRLRRSLDNTEKTNRDLQESNKKLAQTQAALKNSLSQTQAALQRSLLAEKAASIAQQESDSINSVLQFSSEAMSISLLAENLAIQNPNLSLQLANYAYEHYGVELTRKNLVKRWANNNHHRKVNQFRVGEILTVHSGPFENLALTGGKDGSVYLWEVNEGEVLQEYLGHTAAVVKALISPDSTKVLTASKDATIRLWDLGSGALLQTFTGHIGEIYDIAFFPNSKEFVSVGQDQIIIRWDINSGTEVNTVSPSVAKSDGVSCLTVSPNGEYLLAGSANGSILLFNLLTMQEEFLFYGHQDWVNKISFLSDGNRFVSASKDGLAILWNLKTGRFIRSFVGHQEEVTAALELPQKEWIITSSADRSIMAWDLNTGKQVTTLQPGHQAKVNDLSLLPNSALLLSCAGDNLLQVWDLGMNKQYKRFTGHSDKITALALLDKGNRIITGHESGKGYIWSASSGNRLYSLNGHERMITSIATNPNQQVLTGDLEGKIVLRDHDGREQKTFQIPGKLPVNSLSLNAFGTKAVSASPDQVIRVWDLNTFQVLHQLKGHTKGVTVTQFSPNEDHLISGARDSLVILWDYQTGLELSRIRFDLPVSCLAYHPTTPEIAIGLQNGECQIRDYRSKELLVTMTGHDRPVKSLAFSFDGTRLLSGASDNKFILWSANDGRQIKSFQGHTGPVLALAFQEQSHYILSASEDQTARIWDYQPNYLTESKVFNKEVVAMANHPDSTKHLLAIATVDSVIDIYHAQTGLLLSSLRIPDRGKVLSLAFHPTLGHLFAGCADGQVYRWNVNQPEIDVQFTDPKIQIIRRIDTTFTTKDIIKRLDTFFVSRAFPVDTKVNSVAISPDGEHLIAGGANGKVKLWHLPTKDLIQSYKAHNLAITCLGFHPTEDKFISGSKDNTLRYWSFDQEYQLRSFLGHQADITSLSVDPSGQFLASSALDETVKIWDLETGSQERTIRTGHSLPVVSVDFHPYLDPSLLLTCSEDRTCKTWDVDSGEEVQSFNQHGGELISGLFSAEGRFVFTIARDNQLRKWVLIRSLEEILDWIDPLEDLLKEVPGEDRPTIWPSEYLNKEVLQD